MIAMMPWTQRFALVALVLSSACARPGPSLVAEPAPVAVAPPLRAEVDRAAVRAQLAEHRARQIEHLHEYGAAGQFPHNVTTAPSLHMFRDPEGRLCAVANLIQTDGRGDLVEATVREHNDLAIADVRDGAMMEWVNGSGLTQEELVRIQLPAPVLVHRAKPQPTARSLEVAKASEETKMNEAVAKHVADVEGELRAETEKSLDVAVERYLAARGSGV